MFLRAGSMACPFPHPSRILPPIRECFSAQEVAHTPCFCFNSASKPVSEARVIDVAQSSHITAHLSCANIFASTLLFFSRRFVLWCRRLRCVMLAERLAFSSLSHADRISAMLLSKVSCFGRTSNPRATYRGRRYAP